MTHFKTFKKLAAVAVLFMGMASLPSTAHAQGGATVGANLTVQSTFTVTDIQDMDFGTWFLVFRNADVFSLVMSTASAATVTGLGPLPADSKPI